MSYTKSTDFAGKDVLLTGDPNKIIRGTEIDDEFDAIAAADAVNFKTDGSPLPIANGGTAAASAVAALQSLGALASNAVAKTAAYTVVVADRGKVFVCTNTFTIGIDSSVTLGAGFSFGVINSGSGVITIDPNSGGQTIDGVASVYINPGQSCFVISDGSNFYTVGINDRTSTYRYEFSATGGETSVDLPYQYEVGANAIAVYRNGLRLTLTTDYTETDSDTIGLVTTAVAGDAYVIDIGVNVNDASSVIFRDGTVTTAKIADNAVTVGKIQQIATGKILGRTTAGTGDVEVIDMPSSTIPAGAVMPFAMSTAPSDWLECDGSVVSRVTYSTLFAAIGTTFGAGDGSTTFGLPDLRGEFVRGWDNSRGVDSGRVFGSAQSDEFESHTHSITANATNGNAGTVSIYSSLAAATYTNSTNIQATGSTETRPRNIALMYCIKT